MGGGGGGGGGGEGTCTFIGTVALGTVFSLFLRS